MNAPFAENSCTSGVEIVSTAEPGSILAGASVASAASPAAAERAVGLDFLRFFAAVSVVGYHYASSYIPKYLPDENALEVVRQVTRYGYLGVDLFFMISGFVIAWSAEGRTAIQFAVSRFSRLYPTFWAALAFTALLIALLGTDQQRTLLAPSALAANVTMVPALLGAPRLDDVYWTLELELRFYALVFLVLALGMGRHLERLVYAWIGIVVLQQFVPVPDIVGAITLGAYGAFFGAGCLLYFLHARGPSTARLAFLALAAVTSVWYSVEQRGQFLTPDPESAIVVPVLVATMIGTLYAGARLKVRGRTALVVTGLGALTYPLYLTHAVLGTLLIKRLSTVLPPSMLLLCVTALALAVARVFVVLVDEPARRPVATACNRLLERLLGRRV
jgi:peptidoglycan/LPS O-acetylase OafA/YrhL